MLFFYDLDNTLYRESDYLYAVIKAFSREEGYALPDFFGAQFIENRLDRRRPDVLSNLFQLAFNSLPTRLQHERLFNIYKTLAPIDGLAPYNCVRDILSFTGGKGENILATNGIRPVQENKIRLLNIGEYFSRILILDKPNLQKPNLGVLIDIVKSHKKRPQESVIIGDDPINDIMAGKKHGFVTIRIKKGFFAGEKCNADYEVADACGLKDVIGGLLNQGEL